MIQVDYREGEMLGMFPPNTAVEAFLDSADYRFIGVEHSSTVIIGIERKRITDFVNSVISGRLIGEQLPKMQQEYDHIYIILEGYYTKNANNGYLNHFKYDVRLGNKYVVFDTFMSMQYTLINKVGITILHSFSKQDTVDKILALEKWWQYADVHSSHKTIYNHQPIRLHKPSVLEMVASCLPGISGTLSVRVAKYFKTVENMANADVFDWTGIEGIGKKKAKQIVESVRGNRDE